MGEWVWVWVGVGVCVRVPERKRVTAALRRSERFLPRSLHMFRKADCEPTGANSQVVYTHTHTRARTHTRTHTHTHTLSLSLIHSMWFGILTEASLSFTHTRTHTHTQCMQIPASEGYGDSGAPPKIPGVCPCMCACVVFNQGRVPFMQRRLCAAQTCSVRAKVHT